MNAFAFIINYWRLNEYIFVETIPVALQSGRGSFRTQTSFLQIQQKLGKIN